MKSSIKVETTIKNLFAQALTLHIQATGRGIAWKEQAAYTIDRHQIKFAGADLCGLAQVNVTLDGIRWFASLTNEEKNSRLPATKVCGAAKKAWVPQPDFDLRPSSERFRNALTEIAAGRV